MAQGSEWVTGMITLSDEWVEIDTMDPATLLMARRPRTDYGCMPVVLVKRLLRAKKGIEEGVYAILASSVGENPTCRVLDVGGTSLDGHPAVVAMFTYSTETQNMTQMLYYVAPEGSSADYVLAFAAATADFGPTARAFTDIVASFRLEEA